MKARTKALVLALCAVMLVTATVFATMAFLTSKDEVVNTFTIGKVAITLDEADVDEYGFAETNDSGEYARVKENDYTLIPGRTYTKDPTVHVQPGSEASWIFVKIDNLDLFEVALNERTIKWQITDNGWTELEGVDGVYGVYGVYYKSVEKNDTPSAKDYKVFAGFTIMGDISDSDEAYAALDGKELTITAYAIQRDGFDTAEAAWAQLDTVFSITD